MFGPLVQGERVALEVQRLACADHVQPHTDDLHRLLGTLELVDLVVQLVELAERLRQVDRRQPARARLDRDDDLLHLPLITDVEEAMHQDLANARVAGKALNVDIGFVEKRPREPDFQSELDAEIGRLETFL